MENGERPPEEGKAADGLTAEERALIQKIICVNIDMVRRAVPDKFQQNPEKK